MIPTTRRMIWIVLSGGLHDVESSPSVPDVVVVLLLLLLLL